MKVEVQNITKTDKRNKDDEEITIYKMILKGETNTDFGYLGVKFKVILESESKEALGNWCTMEIGEIRNLMLTPLINEGIGVKVNND